MALSYPTPKVRDQGLLRAFSGSARLSFSHPRFETYPHPYPQLFRPKTAIYIFSANIYARILDIREPDFVADARGKFGVKPLVVQDNPC